MNAARLSSIVFVVATSLPQQLHSAEKSADQIGTARGICVLLGDHLAESAIELAETTELTIIARTTKLENLRQLQETLDQARLLGTRIYAGAIEDGRLDLADNLADAVVVLGSGRAPLPREELTRVLQPRGRLIIGGIVSIKPVPDGIGEWTHPYHGADNNPLAEDRIARAPYLTQFLATPWYGPMPEITLSSGGRLFKAFGHLAFKEREWPMVGKLVAMNAFNGVQLWERDMEPGFMIHRNTIVATPDTLYLADHVSCKLIDAATGEIKDEIVVPENLAKKDGSVWKWMTIRDGVLYALVGEQEKLHGVHRGTRGERGWPWQTVKATYGDAQSGWGFGRTLFAMDLKSRKVRWSREEKSPVDSRAVAMSGNQVFIYSHQKFLAAINVQDGSEDWRTDSAAVLNAIGEHDPADNPRLGYSTSSYIKSTSDALFFAGPQRKKLVAVSAKNGSLLWAYPSGNMQLVIRNDGLYAMGRLETSKKFDPLTGEILADLQCFRGNCTRATGTADSIFARGYRHTGTLRFDLDEGQPHRIPAMRPACQDGVLASNGQLYWGPWMCDCNHSLVGVISLCSAGDFKFSGKASDEKNLRVFPTRSNLNSIEQDSRDWPTYRHDNRRSNSTPVKVSDRVELKWRYSPKKNFFPTPTVAVDESVYFSGSDGIVRALDSTTGKSRWNAYTEGRVFYPPTFSAGRLLIGSADGFVYSIEAGSGETLWKFRAAPTERRLPVYGRLSSTWPVASGVMVEDGVAYAAAGIASHDGTYVYGLDASTGSIVWQNSDSNNLAGGEEITGVSVQGHLLYNDGKVYMAGGNVVSPAIYDASNGKCLNTLKADEGESLDTHWQMQRSSRGSELFLDGDNVVTGGRMLYSKTQYGIDSRYNGNYALQAAGSDVVIRGTDQLIARVDPGKIVDGKPAVVWKRKWFTVSDAIVIAENAIVVSGQMPDVKNDNQLVPAILALNLEDGSALWSHRLPERTVKWAITIGRTGDIYISLANGEVMCLGGSEAP